MPKKRVNRSAQSHSKGKNQHFKQKPRKDSNIFARHNWQVKVNRLIKHPGLENMTFEGLRALEDECLTLFTNKSLTGEALRTISKIQHEIKAKMDAQRPTGIGEDK